MGALFTSNPTKAEGASTRCFQFKLLPLKLTKSDVFVGVCSQGFSIVGPPPKVAVCEFCLENQHLALVPSANLLLSWAWGGTAWLHVAEADSQPLGQQIYLVGQGCPPSAGHRPALPLSSPGLACPPMVVPGHFVVISLWVRH